MKRKYNEYVWVTSYTRLFLTLVQVSTFNCVKFRLVQQWICTRSTQIHATTRTKNFERPTSTLNGATTKETISSLTQMSTICNQCVGYIMSWLASIGIIYNADTMVYFYSFIIRLSGVSNSFVLNLIQLEPFMYQIVKLICNLVIMLIFDVIYRYCTAAMCSVCKILYYVCLLFFFYFSSL